MLVSLTDDGWVLNTQALGAEGEEDLAAALACTSVSGSYDDPGCLSTYCAVAESGAPEAISQSRARAGCSHDGEDS